METALLYRYGDKHLSFKLREKLTSSQMDVKFHGELNTTTGGWNHDVQILSALLPFNGFKSRREGKRAREPYLGICGIGGRIHYSTHTESTRYKFGFWAKNEIRFDSPNDCWARIDLESMYNPHCYQFEHVLHARVNKIFMSLTSRQDLKCTVGWQGVAFNNQTRISGKSYVEIQENNWSAQMDSDKRISLMYHL